MLFKRVLKHIIVVLNAKNYCCVIQKKYRATKKPPCAKKVNSKSFILRIYCLLVSENQFIAFSVDSNRCFSIHFL